MSAAHDEATVSEIHRRAFLGSVALGTAPLIYGASPGTVLGDEPTPRAAHPHAFPGVISRQRNPDNLEFPFPTLEKFLTPNEQFYVRNHFEAPKLDPNSWTLAIEGAVERPLEIGYDELRKMPSRTLTCLLECAGNSRVFLKPPQVGIRWEQGAVSNAQWTGVSLASVLERAGVKRGAVEVILEGADKGRFDPPDAKTPGIIAFARSLPLEKARQDEVLLAYEMNGKELPLNHGFPVRAIVPGWYGMASVKWLKRIAISERPFHGFFQTFAYTVWERRGGLPDLVPVTQMQVKAQIARPALNEVVSMGSKYRIFGAAWAGENHVAKVDISTDGGKRWSEARLLDKPVRYAWRFWEHEWTPRLPGRYTLMARATDSRQRVQPMERDEDRRDAVISHVQPIQVDVQ